jgi:predicted dehydrogenase
MTENRQFRRIRLGMVGGGPGAFIGAVHRIAARLDDRYELVAGALAPIQSAPAPARRHSALPPIVPMAATRRWQPRKSPARPHRGGVDVTPNHRHHGPAKLFLESGFHVICDKPLTTNLR